MEIISKLELLGIKKIHAKAYISLLKLQKASPHQIAKNAGIERTTIYKTMEELSSDGLATKVIQGKRIFYTANDPLKLMEIQKEKESVLEQLVPLLMGMKGKENESPRVKFYNNIEGIKKALNESLNCKEKIRRDIAFVDSVIEFLGSRFIHNHIEERVKRKIKVLSLRRDIGIQKKSEKDWYLKKDNKSILREVRYLDVLNKFNALILVYDNTVCIISSKKESYALVIESPEFSQTMKTLFDLGWKVAK